MSGVEIIFAVLSIVASGGFVTLLLVRRQAKKLGAETTKIEIESAIAATDEADERLLNIVRTQAEFIVSPLQDEIKELRAEVAHLREQVRNISHLYRILLGWARSVIVWKPAHPDLDPPLPPLPPEIADEI